MIRHLLRLIAEGVLVGVLATTLNIMITIVRPL